MYFDSVRDVWEAVVVYSFMNVILFYCRGENNCLSEIMNNPGAISHPCPFHLCFNKIQLDASFLRYCKRATIQFVVVKPVMAIIEVLPNASNSLSVFIIIVYNISYTLALYALFLFYLATHEHSLLHQVNPLLKFLSVKIIVFATYYQSLVFYFSKLSKSQSLQVNSFILCLEMSFFAVLHAFAFSFKDFVLEEEEVELKIGSLDSEDKKLNFKNVMNMKDITRDAYYNFNLKYKSHVMLENPSTVELETSLSSEETSKVTLS